MADLTRPGAADAPSLLARHACRVLEEDLDLLEAIPEGRRSQALRDCVARCVDVPVEAWPAAEVPRSGQGLGLLVIAGLLLRRVGVDGRFGAELLGAGDLLRPWQGEDEHPTLAVTTGWRVIEPARLAVLDERFMQRSARYPRLHACLVGRALNRARWLAVNMAIVHQPRVETRLQMLLWHLAARWGKVTAGGVRLPLRLSHGVLAELTAARRPTVSAALSEMARRGVVLQVDGGWSLAGSPPSDLVELSPVASLPAPAPAPRAEAKPRAKAEPRPETEPRPEAEPSSRPAAPASPAPASARPSPS